MASLEIVGFPQSTYVRMVRIGQPRMAPRRGQMTRRSVAAVLPRSVLSS